MLLRNMFSRRWRLLTLLVFAATLVLIRLGIWQLDRLEGRRAFNAHYLEARAMPELDLNSGIPDSVSEMEYRAVKVIGNYDFSNQIVVRNQYFQDRVGYHLLTPLRFDGTQRGLFAGTAVLVDRGWIPTEGNATPEDWRNYDEPGEIALAGRIRLGTGKPAFGGVDDALPEVGSRLEFWNNLDIAAVAGQLPYPILPVYIQPVFDPLDSTPPIAPPDADLDLTEGSHFGYAMQWFTFAALLFFGYPYFLKKQDAS